MRVRASPLNYRDLMVLKGGGRGPTKIGVVPLSDGAGEVAEEGENREAAHTVGHHVTHVHDHGCLTPLEALDNGDGPQRASLVET